MTSAAYQFIARIGGREFRARLSAGEMLIGSSIECDFVLPDPTVSRRHARLSIDADVLMIEDLGSRNGCFVNGERLVAPRTLTAGTALRLGEVALRVEPLAADDVEASIRFPGQRPPAAEQAVDPTLVSAGLTRFCVRELAPLLADLADGVVLPEFAPRVLNALAAAEPDAGFELRRARDDSLLARSGTPAVQSAERQRGGLILRYGDASTRSLPALQTLADLGLSLMVAAERGVAGKPAKTLRPATTESPQTPETAHPALREIYWQAAKIAASRLNVVIGGESGTGKELLARYLHAASDEPRDRFLVLNCAALPADLLDAELFGIDAGVATGVSARAGRFELAHGGSLFLDEIGDMSLDTQARILRVLQEREVYRVGSHQPRPADVRVISASNRDLQALVREGRFRLDLYHRIADWRAELPPLRARREDIPNLAAQFLGRALQARGLIGGGITQGAVDALLRYRWPGNVRELEREMQRAALFLNEGEALPSGMLKAEILSATDVVIEDESLSGQLAQEERRIIAGVLAQHAGDIATAAERLGVSKSTLYRRLASLGLSGEA